MSPREQGDRISGEVVPTRARHKPRRATAHYGGVPGPVGWYPDPEGDSGQWRYWDGQSWDRTQSAEDISASHSVATIVVAVVLITIIVLFVCLILWYGALSGI